MLSISQRVSIPEHELQITAVRAQGAGGQNVNKLSTAIHLRFDSRGSSLPDFYKQRLLALADRRISKEGIITIKAQRFRSQEQNKQDAFARLVELIRQAGHTQKPRKPTRPTRAAREKRLENKNKRSQLKALREKIR